MTPTSLTPKEFEEMESLLPWYATGALSGEEYKRVEAALAHDEVLMQRLELVREELVETANANEQLGTPGTGSFDRMMDMIDAEPAPAFSLSSWIRGLLSKVDSVFTDLAPATVRMGAALAAIVIVAQGVIIGSSLMEGDDPRYVSASGGSSEEILKGTFALVKFTDKATAGDIAAYLAGLKATIVDGPKPGGIYRVRLSAKILPAEARTEAIAALRKNANLVELVLPAANNE